MVEKLCLKSRSWVFDAVWSEVWFVTQISYSSSVFISIFHSALNFSLFTFLVLCFLFMFGVFVSGLSLSCTCISLLLWSVFVALYCRSPVSVFCSFVSTVCHVSMFFFPSLCGVLTEFMLFSLTGLSTCRDVMKT